MKKILIFFLSVILLTGCYKQPNYEQLSSDFVVLTNFDSLANFKDYKTFVMPPGIVIQQTRNPILRSTEYSQSDSSWG